MSYTPGWDGRKQPLRKLPEIAGLIRVSTKGQAGSSPKNQREVLAAAGATRFIAAFLGR